MLLRGVTEDGSPYEVCYPFRGSWKGGKLSCRVAEAVVFFCFARHANTFLAGRAFAIPQNLSSLWQTQSAGLSEDRLRGYPTIGITYRQSLLH